MKIFAIITFIVFLCLNYVQSQTETQKFAYYYCPYEDKDTWEPCKARCKSELITPIDAPVAIWQHRCAKGHKWKTKNDESTPLK